PTCATSTHPPSLPDALPIYGDLEPVGRCGDKEVHQLIDVEIIARCEATQAVFVEQPRSQVVRDIERVVADHLEPGRFTEDDVPRSEEHTSELQSRENLVCRL